MLGPAGRGSARTFLPAPPLGWGSILHLQVAPATVQSREQAGGLGEWEDCRRKETTPFSSPKLLAGMAGEEAESRHCLLN